MRNLTTKCGRRKQPLFFKKAAQKTLFDPEPGPSAPVAQNKKSLFASFSSEKEGLAP